MRLGKDKTKIITKNFKSPSKLTEGFILGLVSSFRKDLAPPSWI